MTQADIAHGNLAAHYLVSSPLGWQTRLQTGAKPDTSYKEKFEELACAIWGGFVVAGGTNLPNSYPWPFLL